MRDIASLVAGYGDTDIGEHLQYIYDVCVGVSAQRILELGVRTGVSTRALLAAAQRTGGHVWSIDNGRKLQFTPAPDDPWTFLLGDTRTVGVPLDWVDVTLIDSSHTYDVTLAELRRFAPLTRHAVLLHDTHHPDKPPDVVDVLGAVRDYRAEDPGWTFTNREFNNGLGTMRRTAA